MIGDSNTPFRIRPPQLLADSATESAANNSVAQGYQRGYARPAMGTKAGFSVNNRDRMRASQKEATGIAEGAQEAAGIRAEDQIFNSKQQFDNDLLRQQSLAFQYGQMTDQNAANFDRIMAQRSGMAGVANARAQAAMRLRMALLSQGLM